MPPDNNIRDRPEKPMNLGRAIMWMMRHPMRRLIDHDGHWWRYDGDQKFEMNARDGEGWSVCNILVPFMVDYTFTRPERKRKTAP